MRHLLLANPQTLQVQDFPDRKWLNSQFVFCQLIIYKNVFHPLEDLELGQFMGGLFIFVYSTVKFIVVTPGTFIFTEHFLLNIFIFILHLQKFLISKRSTSIHSIQLFFFLAILWITVINFLPPEWNGHFSSQLTPQWFPPQSSLSHGERENLPKTIE